MAGGGGGKQKSSPQIDQLGAIAKQLYNDTSSVRNTMLKQGEEALKTGGIGAQIPMITRALDQSRSQLSTDLASTKEDLAKYRLVGTPFGQSILQNAQVVGNQGISQIPTNFAQGMIAQLPGFVSALTGQGMSGMGQAASAQSNVTSSYNNAYSQILSAAVPKTNMNFSMSAK